jgi:hypothetical protein
VHRRCRGHGRQVPLARPGDDARAGAGSQAEDGLHVAWGEALDGRRHQRRPLLHRQCRQPVEEGIGRAQLAEGRATFLVAASGRRSSSTTQLPEQSRAQPRRGALRVPELGRTPDALLEDAGCREGGTLPIAKRDEQREAMQPGAVQVTEGGAQPIGLALVG